MQSKHFTLSDFYGAWLRIEMWLEQKIEMNSELNLAQRLKDSMNRYKGQLMLNPLMISAIYLDPRFTNTLSKTNKLLAVATLLEIWVQRKSQLAKRLDSDDSDFDRYIANKELDMVAGDNNNCEQSNIDALKLKLHALEKQQRQPSQTNVIKYWYEKRHEEPEIYLLSEIIFAIPSSQTTVERAFSVLAYILNPLRNRLSDEMLENILLLKCNRDLFYEIIEEELENV